jgi:drug/metabolite transporter (DMT)-like permease
VKSPSPTPVPATNAPATPSKKLFTQSTAANDGSFTTQDWALFLAVAAIWGSSFLFIDIGLDAFPPGLITLIRVGSGAAALWALPRSITTRVGRAVPDVRIESDDRAKLLLLSIIWVAIPFTLFPIAEQHINSSVTGLLNGATPIFAATVAAVLLRQRARGPLLLGLVVGFVGIALISAPSIGDGANQASGVFMVLGATVCYGFAINLAAPLQQKYGSLPLMARMLALATVWTTPYGLWELGAANWEIGPLVAVTVLGVFGTGVAFAIMGTLVGRVGSTRASFITYLIPVVSLALGVAFRGDTVAPLAVFGIALVIGGAFLASRTSR